MYREIGEMKVCRGYAEDVTDALKREGFEISIIYDGSGDHCFHILQDEEEDE